MDVRNKIPVIITIAALLYAVIAVLQAIERGSVTPESLILAILLITVAALSWSGERAAEILTARKNAALWLMIVLFLIYGVLKGGGLI